MEAYNNKGLIIVYPATIEEVNPTKRLEVNPVKRLAFIDKYYLVDINIKDAITLIFLKIKEYYNIYYILIFFKVEDIVNLYLY